MKKLLLIGIGFLLLSEIGFSQNSDLMIRSGEKGLYLEHKTAAKESFYSIGRLYNVHPRFLAAYNSLDMNKGLNIGQSLHIPLTDTNFSQQVNKGAPVYYISGANETVSKVSSANSKVPVENLRHWNNLSGDNLSQGSKLIIGFLVSGEVAIAKEITIKTDKPVPAKTDPVEIKPQEAVSKEIVKTDSESVKKEEQKKLEPVFTQVKEEVKTADTGEGFFKPYFEQQIKSEPLSKEEMLTCGIFKTVSGWNDQKYYMLIDNIAPGTIIQIINPSNNKSVYAKVLYGMEGIRQNQGLNIRISDSAAHKLEISDTDKFIVKVRF